MQRIRLTVQGQVQGVGFRPFVFRLAHDLDLTGTVRNTPEGVILEVQGDEGTVETFALDLHAKLPPLARIVSCEREEVELVEAEDEFAILASTAGHGHNVLISPDTATCADCIADMADPANPRHRYPFTNCTNCGPRYTITRSIPYDRDKTSMACFPLCPTCREEYENPLDRRFHAQPNACPECGPEVWLAMANGKELTRGDDALKSLASLLVAGEVCAIKGLGGFHLAVDATNQQAVEELRQRKNRKDKPLAVMVPSIEVALQLADMTDAEIEEMESNRRPITLVRQKENGPLATGISPDTPHVGLMLPYTPLHHVLLAYVAEATGGLAALVMTSGNVSGDPICIGNREALKRLSHIADYFLLHNRDILIRTDDSVLRIDPRKKERHMIRRARGFTPSPVFLPGKGPSVFGTGPELKNTLCITKGNQAFVSQHIGDMENIATLEFYKEIAAHLEDILQTTPELMVHDLHPNYMTTQFAQEQDRMPVKALQHHFAHAHSVLAENGNHGPALCLALDGTGYGEDGTLWGGEALYVDTETMEHERVGRFAHLRLPGGEAAIREPWRIARAALHALGITEPGKRPWPWLKEFEAADRMVGQILDKTINCPLTSSCGRLFDAVSAMLGLKMTISYEGQAAIALEQAQNMDEHGMYPCSLNREDGLLVLDTLELFNHVYADWERGEDAAIISRRFHNGLIHGLTRWQSQCSEETYVPVVGLSGGVMQNMTLATTLPLEIEDCGRTPLVHKELPPNDACISLGQAAWGQLFLKKQGL